MSRSNSMLLRSDKLTAMVAIITFIVIIIIIGIIVIVGKRWMYFL